MFNTLYLEVRKDKSIYILRDSELDHMCLSTAESLEEILNNTGKIVKKYKTDAILQRRINATSESLHIGRKEGIRINKYISENGFLFNSELRKKIRESLEEIEYSSVRNKNRRLFKKLTNLPLNPEISSKKEENTENAQSRCLSTSSPTPMRVRLPRKVKKVSIIQG